MIRLLLILISIFFINFSVFAGRPSNNSSTSVVGGGDACEQGSNAVDDYSTNEQDCKSVKKTAIVIDDEGKLQEKDYEVMECE